MKKYPKYKNSGVAWLGEIPEHWEVRKLKKCTVIKTGRTPKIESSKVDYFKNGNVNWFTPSDFCNSTGVLKNSKRKVIENAIEERQVELFEEKSVYLIGVGATVGKVGFSLKKASANQQINNIKFSNDIYFKYGYYSLLISKTKINLLVDFTTLPILNQSKNKEILILIPPLPEQIAIANFLDYKLEKIDRFISKKKQLIKLLNEQKAAIINQAVTKGINPNAKMKPSGIEWLGDIPENWEVRKLKHVGTIKNGATPSTSQKEYWDGDIIWTTPAEINNIVFINNSNRKITRKGYESCGTHIVPKNSIILTTRAPIGKVAISGVELCTNQGCKSIVVNNIYFKFLYFQMIIYKDVLNSLGRGTTFMELGNEALKNLKIPVPPISEQTQIVQYIETETNKIAKTISTIEKEIALVEEYKTALIAEAVTGKIDVRNFEVPQIETPLAMVAEEAGNYNKES